eukprot:PhM_4_TR15309/c0_g4_i1/m.76373/K15196/BRF1, GTF3B; transcription factor IIIB 90 kDa subunit
MEGYDCPHPAHEFETDPAAGITICGRCGKVMEENQLRNDLTADVIRHRTNQNPSRYTPRNRCFTWNRESQVASRSITLDSARTELTSLSFRLKTSTAIVTSALRLYGLVLDKNLHTGRRREVSLATCMYMACRTVGTEHLLHEFAEAVGEDVATMHDTYVHYTAGLRMPIPPMDPSVYLSRLATKLDLGDAEHGVITYGTHILARMKKEWIDYGRKPYGIVAAALLIACDVCGVSRDPAQLSSMVNLTTGTILLRLQEFCSALNLTGGGECTTLPPAYRNAQSADSLRSRILSHEQRMCKLRGDLLRAMDSSRSPRMPDASVLRDLWSTYWALRGECASLCESLMERVVLSVNPRLRGDLKTARHTTAIQCRVPMYVPMPAEPALDLAGINKLREDVTRYSMEVDVAGGLKNDASLNSAVERVQQLLESDERMREIAATDASCDGSSGGVLDLIDGGATQPSTQVAGGTQAAEGDDHGGGAVPVPYDDYEDLSVSDWESTDDDYLVTDTEEVARRELQFNALYKDYLQRREQRDREKAELAEANSGPNGFKKRGKRPREEPKPFEAVGPGEAAVMAMSRRPHSGVNMNVLWNLLNGADPDEDVPAWGNNNNNATTDASGANSIDDSFLDSNGTEVPPLEFATTPTPPPQPAVMFDGE